ncbi:hypothetical protein MIR68_011172 [Amoeboaphelidium protococcarum]|nr:hypothetical protein MIR68_011172 [Amoeboaphelidium protococcarum]
MDQQLNKNDSRSVNAESSMELIAVDNLILMYQEVQLGNFDAVFDMLQKKLPAIESHRDSLKKIFHEVHNQMSTTSESIQIVIEELRNIEQLMNQLNSLPIWSVSERILLSLQIAKAFIAVPIAVQRQQMPDSFETIQKLITNFGVSPSTSSSSAITQD